MQKFSLILIVTLLLLTGCQEKSVNTDSNTNNQETTKIEYTIPENYNLDDAEKDGYVKYLANKVINENKIQEFYDLSKANQDCNITIFKLTIEGNYIIEQYYYSNHQYTLFIDNTRDNTSNHKIEEKIIKDIEIIQDSNHLYLNPIY